MTVDEAKRKLLAWAAGEIGYREGANNYNRYAGLKEVTQLLGWNAQCQPWCNIFVDAAFVICFGLETGAAMIYQPVGYGSALCSASAEHFKKHDAFRRPPKLPEAGDVVFFYVGEEINHMGIVTDVRGGSIVTVEGNSGDSVAERVYSIGDSKIAGYGKPNWRLAGGSLVETPEDNENTCTDDSCDIIPIPQNGILLEPPTLRNGMGGVWVAALQGILTWQRYNIGTWGVDGDFGMCTQDAVRNYQTRHGLQSDGIVGPQTWSSMLK